ncbi:MAG: TetR/AcrR family transcriptional regulator [Clostridiales bacterium]|nr:TetR/AcrR family transcriptional regulator [Clostridiales bacterium]
MGEKDLRSRIKEVAVEHFNNHGYHGTTIRNIAREVDCSLPMIYYYYKSKKELFDEIITQDYLLLLKRLAKSLEAKDAIEYYTQWVYNLNNLSNYDRHIYRLGIKVYLSFDGDRDHIEAMEAYEESVYIRHREILKPFLSSPNPSSLVVRTLIHLLDTLIIEIVVKGRSIPQEDIRAEISLLLKPCLQAGTLTT